MSTRASVLVALFVAEAAIAGEMVVALRGEPPRPWLAWHSSAHAHQTGLIESGPHTVFATGAHPALSVDIGYADLTIVAGRSNRVDVALAKSTDPREFGAAPIEAQHDGDTIRVARSDRRFSSGDNRMLTVTVPPETRINVVSAGDIIASGLRAETAMTSAGRGSIVVNDYDGPLLHVDSHRGLELHRVVATRIDAKSNTHVRGTDLHVNNGDVRSDGGRVSLAFAPGADTLVFAETDNGTVNVAGNAAARAAGIDADPSSRTVRIGSASGRLSVRSSDGNIDLTAL